MSAYDHIQTSSEIVKNRFRKAGITSAIDNGVELPEDFRATVSDEDPFNSDSDWNDDAMKKTNLQNYL